MPNVPPAAEDQIGEKLPWEHLTIQPSPDRRFLIYGLAAGLVITVLGVLIFRQFNSPSSADLMPVTPVTAAPGSPEGEGGSTGSETVVTQPTVPTALAEPEAPIGLSEADLRAVAPELVQRQAAARAEWFVLEFFTLDPSDPWLDRVEMASGLKFPSDLAPDTSGTPAVSYVEWTRTRSVEQTAENTFRISILIRRLVATDGTNFRRLPMETVTLTVRLEPDGQIRAASLPAITTPVANDLVPLQESDVFWTIDDAGIGWPSSRSESPGVQSDWGG